MKPGHGDVLLAEGDPELAEDEERLIEEFRRQLDLGMWAAVPTADGVPTRGDHGPRLRRGPARRRAGGLLPAGGGRLRALGALRRSRSRAGPPRRAPGRCCGRASVRELGRATPSGRESSELGFHQRSPGGGDTASGYGYLLYPHRPLVAYDTATGELLCEYCVALSDRDEPASGSPTPTTCSPSGSPLHGGERELIARRTCTARAASSTPARCGATSPGCAPGGMARMPGMTTLPRPRSAAVFDGPDRAAARAYMKGIGFDDDALSRPTIGIANTWIEAMPCNFHLRGLAEHVKEGVRAAGGTPMEFNTIAISDGITMGTKGMKTSLVSREVIADSIELTVARLPVRRRGRALGVRQDDPRRRDGAGAARHPLA